MSREADYSRDQLDKCLKALVGDMRAQGLSVQQIRSLVSSILSDVIMDVLVKQDEQARGKLASLDS